MRSSSDRRATWTASWTRSGRCGRIRMSCGQQRSRRRRSMLTTKITLAVVGSACVCAALGATEAGEEKRPHVKIRGIYGGVPTQLFERGKTLSDYGVNAIFMGSGGITAERLALLKGQGARVFAEF